MKRKLDALAESVPPTPPATNNSDSAKRPRPSPPDAVHHWSFAPSATIEGWLDDVTSDHSSMASAVENSPSLPPSSRRSRSSSPSRKWPNEPLYRRQNIRQANIAFTFFDEIPKHIQELASTLLDGDERLQSVKETFIVTARRLETKGAAEGDWRAAFERLVEDLLAMHGLSTELEVVTERGMYACSVSSYALTNPDRLVARAQTRALDCFRSRPRATEAFIRSTSLNRSSIAPLEQTDVRIQNPTP